MNSLSRALLVVTALGLGTFAQSGCKSSQSHVNDVQQVNMRLQGHWVLQSYRPNMALDPPLASMLAAQFGQLHVVVNGTTINVQGPGVHAMRSFHVQEVVDRTATLVVTEPTGVSVRVWVELRGDLVTFRPLEGPWRGEGTLQRVA